MNKNLIIKIFIVILVLIFITILYAIFNIATKQNNNEVNYINNIANDDTTNDTVIIEDEQDVNNYDEQSAPEQDYNNSDYVFYNEINVLDFDETHLNNFEFKISDIPTELSEFIGNTESFNKQIKKYIYLNGLVDSNIAQYEKHQIEQENNIAKILFRLNNKKNTELMVTVNNLEMQIEIKDR